MKDVDVETLRPDDQKNLESVTVAANWLRQKGFKVSRAKAFRDAKSGFLIVEPDGTVKRENAMTYALGLDFKGQPTPDLNVYTKQKAELETKKIQLQNEKLKFDNERDRGLYVLRSSFEIELSGRCAVFDVSLRHLFSTRAPEWIRMTGGNTEKANLLISELERELDVLLNELATTDKFQIEFING